MTLHDLSKRAAVGLLLAVSMLTSRAAEQPTPSATPPTDLIVPPGFRVELLRSARPGEGSWVCLAIDNKRRLIISPQELPLQKPGEKTVSGGLLRATLGPDGNIARLDAIAQPVGAAMGLLYAFDSLYVNGTGPEGTGLYRLRDTDGDDHFDETRLLKRFEGAFRDPAVGEHGPHGLVLGPDQMLYVINGNEVKPPAGYRPESPYRNFAEDQLLPPQLWPASYGWANGPPPAGSVLRTDRDGRQWTLVAGGLRNAYDLAFNRDGELFTFDSDMDWDDGAPWYRPTRINHLVSGGEYGWRKGTGKWPAYYPDSLPSNLDLGRSSPTGIKFGSGTNFPPRFRRALFLCDWAFGTIYAATLTPSGATYKASAEPFITGRPLNVTDLEFAADGAMYFITGGRGTQSGLYRITYHGDRSRDPVAWELEHQNGLKSRQLRRQLESFHERPEPRAIEFLWPHLDSDDRWIRHAARVALEAQPVTQWRDRALAEPRPRASIVALLALARLGPSSVQPELLASLGRLKGADLAEEQNLDALRVLELTCIRHGRPDADATAAIIRRLDAVYPTPSTRINRELCQLLVFLDAPSVVAKTLPLLASAPTQEDQMHFAFCLRNVRSGWTPDQRQTYFAWFPRIAKTYRGSNKFLGFLADTRADAARNLPDQERAALKTLLETDLAAEVTAPAVTRPFVKDWKMAELIPALSEVSHGRSFARGREAFLSAQCVSCHRFGNEGGAVGPDLSAVAGRFSRHDLLEAILLPSKVVSDQFQNSTLVLKNGDELTGRILAETTETLTLAPNPLTRERRDIPKRDVVRREISRLSPMPEGLVNTLSRSELLDLLAYLESGGRPDYPAFRAQ